MGPTDENAIDNLQYEVPLGTSDHACLVWELAVEVQETVSSVQQKLNYCMEGRLRFYFKSFEEYQLGRFMSVSLCLGNVVHI